MRSTPEKKTACLGAAALVLVYMTHRRTLSHSQSRRALTAFLEDAQAEVADADAGASGSGLGTVLEEGDGAAAPPLGASLAALRSPSKTAYDLDAREELASRSGLQRALSHPNPSQQHRIHNPPTHSPPPHTTASALLLAGASGDCFGVCSNGAR